MEKYEHRPDIIPMIEHEDGRLTEAVPVMLTKPGQYAVHPTAVDRFIKKMLTNGKDMVAFDSHWRHPEYFLSYRIDSVEEVISFTPQEIIASVSTMATSAVEHLVWESGSDEFLVPSPAWLSSLMEGAHIHHLGAIEYYVRRKHGLPLVLAWADKKQRRLVWSLFNKQAVERNVEEKVLWSLIVFSAALRLVRGDGNCLVVTDGPADVITAQRATADALAKGYNGSDPAKLMADGFKFGIRRCSITSLPTH